MNYKVKTTPRFEKELKHLAKKYSSLKVEYAHLVDSLKHQAIQGESLGNKCFKIRLAIASKGKGKSGGARVITYLQLVESTIYLLAIFDKSEMENIPEKEITELINQIP